MKKNDPDADQQCPRALTCQYLHQFMEDIKNPASPRGPLFSKEFVEAHFYQHVLQMHQHHIRSCGYECAMKNECPTVLKTPMDPTVLEEATENDYKAWWHWKVYHPPSAMDIMSTQLTREDTVSIFPEPSVSPQLPLEIRSQQSFPSTRCVTSAPSMGLSLQMTDSFRLGSPGCSLETHNLWTEDRTERMFVNAYCRQEAPKRLPKVLRRIIYGFLEPSPDDQETKMNEQNGQDSDDDVLFMYRLGLLEWRDLIEETREQIRDYNLDDSVCQNILDGVWQCIWENKVSHCAYTLFGLC